jgi:hypothetical protein
MVMIVWLLYYYGYASIVVLTLIKHSCSCIEQHIKQFVQGSVVYVPVSAPLSYQWLPGLIPGLGIMWVEFPGSLFSIAKRTVTIYNNNNNTLLLKTHLKISMLLHNTRTWYLILNTERLILNPNTNTNTWN